MIADPAILSRKLERFEREAWRCSPAWAKRVREHLRAQIRLHAEDPLDLDDDVLELFPEPDVEALDTPRNAYIVVSEGTEEEVVAPLTDVTSLGRGGQNDLTLRGDTKISRYHCQIVRLDASWAVIDLKSANGTLVNGEMLEPDLPRRLYGGEELILGNTFVRFRLRD
ncbi:MAG: FHA domain-containing protein [Alphaproteobacteria bacterium]|nr:FHA domain-containing protein [Alphaproteobacteria bacterium]